MSPKNRDQIRTLQEKVKQALSDAGLLLGNGSVEAAISRGYYAVFQAARAALEPPRAYRARGPVHPPR